MPVVQLEVAMQKFVVSTDTCARTCAHTPSCSRRDTHLHTHLPTDTHTHTLPLLATTFPQQVEGILPCDMHVLMFISKDYMAESENQKQL